MKKMVPIEQTRCGTCKWLRRNCPWNRPNLDHPNQIGEWRPEDFANSCSLWESEK